MTTRDVQTFPASDEVPHEPDDHPLWQESVFLTWADVDQGVYGFHRIGQEVHADDGQGGQGMVTSWNGITTREGLRFRRYLFDPIRVEDRRPSGFSAGPDIAFEHDGEHTTWTIEDPDCSMSLRAADYTPRFDLFRAGGSVAENFAAGHLEVGSAITGSVRIGDRHIDVDGLAYRDHSWGKRDRSTMLSHRWVAGTVGPELTFNATAWHGTDGSLRTYGIVCREGEISYATDVDIVVYMEIDAVSHRGGVLRMTLDDGDTIEIAARHIDGFLTKHHNTGCVDALCDVEWQGRRGFCDLEVSTNPRAGTAPIMGLVRATDQNGLSQRPWVYDKGDSATGVPHVR
ncbi:hypothetical protein [uncultured Jatrophihabitans sp.]|uniref:DUF7065 domain-containing protein n=1 Tax=uncultured Jatrophihabitans sp. TaxID=1610747 RepID=UPI0035CAC332